MKTQSEAALITGSAKRIGKEIALLLSVLGYDIALHYSHSLADAKNTANHIKGNGADCDIFRCDLANEKQVSNLIQKVKKRFPGLRLLINSASVFEKSPLRQGDIKAFKKHFNINLKAPYILSCQFARHCFKGHIINILDTHITENKTSFAAYLLSKKSLGELTKLSAVEFAPTIRVNAIAPGLILEPKGKTENYLARLANKIPLKTKGRPSQIAQAVQYLIESEYVTGQTIFVDGGEHLL